MRAPWSGIVQYIRWCLRFLLHQHSLTIWNSSHRLAQHFLNAYLLYLKKVLGWRVVLITTVPYPYDIYQRIPADITLFDCTDQYSATEFSENEMTIRTFDKVFANTSLLCSLLKKHNPHVTRISSGYCDNLTFRNHSRTKVEKSVVFSGGISRRIDYVLLMELSRRLPEYNFFFLGEIYLNRHYVDTQDEYCWQQWQTLCTRPNVHYLGAFSSTQSLEILPLFQTGIIPYDPSDAMNYHSHPIKLYEYIARGLFVVSTPLPSVKEHAKMFPLFVADTPVRFAQAIVQATRKQYTKQEEDQIRRLLERQSLDRKVEVITQSL